MTVTIYNGVAAGAWFEEDENARLVSYHSKTIGCRHNEFPGVGAFVLLQDIGTTQSYRLKTPDATGWDRVAAFDPDSNEGLADPAPNPAAARGRYLDCNWGGALALRYHFSEPLRTIGGKYYRISVSAASASGAPTGPRTYLSDGLSWGRYRIVGTNIETEYAPIGPNTVGSEGNLFLIPYDAEHEWMSGQYHGSLDTTDFADGRFLLTVEVFNASGQRIRPNGSAGAGIDAAFTFRRWYQPEGPTAEVPFAGLTHLFWWDNRKAVADIVDLRKGGVASPAQCQFLSGIDTTDFSVGYRAYHPNPKFLLNHSLWWKRGLNGDSGFIISGSPDNIGAPPAPVGESPTTDFSVMLGANIKCSFAVTLDANVKTTNGSGPIYSYNDSELAAFALDRSGS